MSPSGTKRTGDRTGANFRLLPTSGTPLANWESPLCARTGRLGSLETGAIAGDAVVGAGFQNFLDVDIVSRQTQQLSACHVTQMVVCELETA